VEISSQGACHQAAGHEAETNIPFPWWFIAIITILVLIVIRVLYRVIRGK
jgi:hypothetical protein